MTISVAGVQAGGNVAAQDGVAFDSTGGPAGMATSTTGAQNVATILVNLPDFTLASNVTPDLMSGILYGNLYSSAQSTPDWSVDDFWQQNSDGQAFAPYAGGQIAGPYQLTSDFNTDSNGAASCDYLSMLQAALDAADPFVNLQNFSRIVIVFPYNGACAWAGLGSIGSWTNHAPLAGSFTASVAWLRSDQLTSRATGVQLAAHELGHGLGLHHASTRDFSTPLPRLPAGVPGIQSTWDEYGDVFSVMGYWSFGLYPSSQAQEILGWLGPANYRTVSTSGQYGVEAYETRNASGMVKALKILRDSATNSWLWLEYRTRTGNYDSQLNAQVWSGALIHYEDAFTNLHSNLLDFTPGTTQFTDPALAVGQTWTDSYTNLSITVNNITGSMLNVTITYGPPPCVHANPAVTLSPPNPSVNGGYATTYAVAVTNNDTATCAPSTFSLTAAQPAGFTATLSAASVTIAPGAGGNVTLTEKASATIGTYPVSVAATSTSNASYSATGTANVTVTNTCMPANPTVTMSPASASVLPGAARAFTVTVKNNNSPLCSQATFALAAPQPSGFTGTLSYSSVSIKSGVSANVTLTAKASSTAGAYSIPVTATNSGATSYSGAGTAALNVVPCTLANPTVSWSPASASAAPSGSAAFTVTVYNNNASVCAAAAFALASPQPSGLTGALSYTSVTIKSGAGTSVTLTEKAGTAAGTYAVRVTATNSAATTYSGASAATLNVVPCTMASPTLSFSPPSASVNYLAAAKFTVTVLNNNSTTCAAATFTLSAASMIGLKASLSASSVTLASGAGTAATLTETAATTPGTFSPAVTATNKSYTSLKSTGTATLTVVATTVTVTTGSASYQPLSAVTMTATVAGAIPIAGASATFTLKRPSGATTTYTTTTNSSGVATWKYTLVSGDPNGTYTASAIATVSNVKYTSPAGTLAVSP